jgi:hypothetical protein
MTRRRKRILQGHRPSAVLAGSVSVEFVRLREPAALIQRRENLQDADDEMRAAWRAVWSTP